MTAEDKELLFKDLCARLPYGVKIEYDGKIYSLSRPYLDFMRIINGAGEKSPSVNECKPYLRPMGSMTKEEKKEYLKVRVKICTNTDDYGQPTQYELCNDFKTYDWLNAHHFDYRGLIEKGLAIEAPEGIYNIE